MTEAVSETLTTLTTSFSDFKERQDDRLKQLDELLQKSTQRIEKMELSLQRPVLFDGNDYKKTTSSEFAGFVRKGVENNLNLKSLTSQTEASGGYLIPAPIVKLINQNISSLSIIRQLSTNTTINSDSLDILLEKKETEAGWVSEVADRDETEAPELAKIHIPVHQIYAKPKVSQKLLDDSAINIEQWISEKIADKFSKIENIGFLHGDGNNKPRGILAAESCKLDMEEWGKVSTLITGVENDFANPDQLLDVVYSLKAKYQPGAVWVMPRSVAVKLAKIKDNQGQYLWQQSLSANHPNTLLGYPVYLCDDMVQEKKPIRILFGNIKDAYQVVDRANMTMLRDPFTAKPYVEFYATKRVGADIIRYDAIKYIQLTKE